MKNNAAVIIINYNGINDTLECVESLRKSTVSADIIIVDNASDNDEGKRLNEFCQDDTVLISSDNLGFAGGNNLGIRRAMDMNYEYIILLNNDTVIDPEMIGRLLKEASDTTIAVPAMYYFGHPDEPWYYGGEINRWTGNAINYEKKGSDTGNKEVSFATGCCMAIHRAIFEKVGMLDDSFFMYFEDAEFCIRCQKNGIKILFVPEAKLWHKVGRSSGGNGSALSIYYVTRNRLNCVKKYRDCFKFTAYPFSLYSRYFRMLQMRCSRKSGWRAFKVAIRDHKAGVTGKRNIIL